MLIILLLFIKAIKYFHLKRRMKLRDVKHKIFCGRLICTLVYSEARFIPTLHFSLIEGAVQSKLLPPCPSQCLFSVGRLVVGGEQQVASDNKGFLRFWSYYSLVYLRRNPQIGGRELVWAGQDSNLRRA